MFPVTIDPHNQSYIPAAIYVYVQIYISLIYIHNLYYKSNNM